MSPDEYTFSLIFNKTAFVQVFLVECCLLFLYIFLVGHILIASLLEVSVAGLLSQFRIEFLLKGLLQFGHDGFYLLVFEGILCIL